MKLTLNPFWWLLISFALTQIASAAVPVLTSFTNLTGTEDQSLTISFADVDGASDATNSPTGYKRVGGSALNGSLNTNSNGTELESGETWTWTPPTNANGVIAAITLEATNADGDSAHIVLSVDLGDVNDTPTFTPGSNVTVNEDSGAYSAAWATAISSGPNTTYPDDENVSFTISDISTAEAAAFSSLPAISANGTLTFTPAANFNTSSAITMTVTLDDGVTANGSLPTATLSISTTPVNDTPSFTKGADVTVNEDTAYTSPSAWATARSTGPSDESGQTLSFNVSVDNTSAFSDQPEISPSGILTFTPSPNFNTGSPSVPVVLTVTVSDDGSPVETSSSQTANINITPVNDVPVFGGTIPENKALTNVSIDIGSSAVVTVPPTSELSFFSAMTPDDVDGDAITITVSVPTSADNLLDVYTPDDTTNPATGNVSSGNRVFSKTGTITAVRTWFQGVKFERDPLVTDRTSADISVAISITDTFIPSPVTQSGSFRLNFEPPVDITVIPGTVVEGNSIKPFSGLQVAGRSASTQTELTLSLADDSYASLNGSNSVVLSGTLTQVNSDLQNVAFSGEGVTSDQDVDVTVTVTGVDTITKTISVTAINFPPTITSLPTSASRVDDDKEIKPLASVSVQDPENDTVTLTLRLLDNTLGAFSLATGASGTINTVSTVGSVTTYTINAADKGLLVFTPIPDVIPLGQSETVQFEFFGSDPSGNTTTTFTIDILITAVAGAPSISSTDPAFGTSEPLKIDPATKMPFTSVSIIDEAGNVEVTITLDNEDKGALTTLGGFTNNGGGVYSFTGTLANANAALQAIVFENSSSSDLFAPNEPGRTDFTIEVLDESSNRATEVISIVLIGPSKNFLVVNSFDVAGDAVLGSLRHAVENAASGDTITIALETYPATIFLNRSLTVNENVFIRGPGADLFTISGDKDRNGIVGPSDIQIFRVFADLKLQGLTLSGGYANEFGGAISIERLEPYFPAVNVEVRDCVVRDSVAGRFGGAIDSLNCSLLIDRCSFVGNSTTSNGQGGGAISLYTNEDCAITNTTFAQNVQGGAQGFGGAALYIENTDTLNLLRVDIQHCTFSENTDAAAAGTSLCVVAGNTLALVGNSIFADGADYNLYLSGGAEIVSEGGNISDDDTTTLLVRSGNPQQIALLSEDSDITGTDPGLGLLTQYTGGLYAYPLIGGGEAATMDTDESNEALDIRGALRLDSANVGALQQSGTLGRIIINEILWDPGDATGEQEDFIELYVPRDAGAVDLDGYSLFVDGTSVFEFSSVSIDSGLGHIVKRGTTTVTVPTTEANDLDLLVSGTVELRDGDGNTVISESYVADFWNPTVADTALILTEDESITLAPQFFGHAYVPHSLVKAAGYRDGVDMDKTGGSISSEYQDSDGSPIDGSNGAPTGNPDEYTLFEGQVVLLDVLANDFDPDGDPLDVTDANIANTTNLTITSAGTAIELVVGSAFDSMSVGSKSDLVFTYTPQDDQDPSNLSLNPATVSISVIGRNDTPVAVSDTYSTTESQSLKIYADGATPSENLLNNDTDADSDDSKSTLNVVGVVTPISIDSYSENSTSGKVDANITGHGLNAGDVIKIYDFDSHYAGLQTVVSVINANTVELDFAYDSNATPDDHWHLVQRASLVSAYSEAISGLLRATLPSHGLSTGDFITITGASTVSYNGSHAVTVVDANTVDLNVDYVDASGSLGQWTLDGAFDASVITDSTMSAYGAEVEFFLRQVRSEMFVGYDPEVSPSLNALALAEPAMDRFFYAIEDSHGAVSVAEVLVNITGENDAPDLQDDPGELENLKLFSAVSGYSDSTGDAAATLPAHGLENGDSIIIQGYAGDASYNAVHTVTVIDEDTVDLNVPFADALLPGGEWRPVDQVKDFLADARVVYAVAGSVPNTVNTRIENSQGVGLVMIDTPSTTQEQSITISGLVFLENDSDPDTSDVLSIVASLPSTTSRLGAELTLQSSNITYDPSDSSVLQNLPRSGAIVDSFEVTVTDDTVSGKTIVAVVVFGDNDQPEASDESYSFTENDLTKVNGGMIGDGTISIDVTNQGLVRNATDDDQTQFGILYAVPSASQTLSDNSSAAIDYATRTEEITSFAAVSGQSELTRVTSAVHGLSSGDAVFIRAVPGLYGNFIVTVENDDQFTIELAHDVSYNSLTGVWFNHQGTLFIDSVVDFDSLAVGDTLEYTYDYWTTDGSLLFATNDLFLINTDSGTHTLDVLANDFNFNALQSEFVIIGVELPSEGGIVEVTEDGLALEYRPVGGFVGTDVIVYTIQDSYGNIDRANALIRVTTEAINGRIFAKSDVFSVSKGAISAVELDVLANDVVLPSTATGEGLQITSIDVTGVDGSLSFDGNLISYIPDSGSIKTVETFSYTVSGGGSVSEEVGVTLNVVDNTLTLIGDVFHLPTDSGPVSLDVLVNDVILPDSADALTIQILDQAPTKGVATILEGGGAIQYTPNDGFIGRDTLSYNVIDANGATGSSIVTIYVGYLVANPDFYSLPADETITFDVLANDVLIPGNASGLTLNGVRAADGSSGSFVTSGTFGQLTVDATSGQLEVTSSGSWNGELALEYQVQAGLDSFNVLVTFSATSAPIRASGDLFEVLAGTTEVSIDVVDNDYAVDEVAVGTPIKVPTIISVTTPDRSGIASIDSSNNVILYTPSVGFTGVETFDYTISNGVSINVARCTVTVSEGKLFANNDGYQIFFGSVDNELRVLSNDLLLPNEDSALEIVSIDTMPAADGTVALSPDGTFIAYNPPATLPGSAVTFGYEISDGSSRRARATVTLNVSNRSDTLSSETNNDSFRVSRNASSILLPILLNDNVKPASAADWIITSIDSQGTSVVTAEGGQAVATVGGIVYTAPIDFSGTDTFTYAVSDSLGGTGDGVIIVRVGDLRLVDDIFTLSNEEVPVSLDVLANDGIFKGGAVADSFIESINAASVSFGTGLVSIGPDNDTLIYTPDGSSTAQVTLTYTVEDASGNEETADVVINLIDEVSDRHEAEATIIITGINDSPVLGGTEGDSITDKESTFPFDTVTLSDVDADGDEEQTVTLQFDATLGSITHTGMTLLGAGSYQVVGTPSEVQAALRSIEFTPTENISPPVTYDAVLTLTVTDGHLLTPIVDLTTITILGINDAPVAGDDFASTAENQAIRILVDDELLSAAFNFGDLDANYEDQNAAGATIVLTPELQNFSLLSNDDDIDSDNDNDATDGGAVDLIATLEVINVHTTDTTAEQVTTVSDLGASVRLDIRANRLETSIVYDPRSSNILNAMQTGEMKTDSFYYTIRDIHGELDVAKVTVQITGVNDVLTANDDPDYFSVEDVTLTLQSADLLENDTDPDQDGDSGNADDVLSILSVDAISKYGAAVSLNAGNTEITYDPVGVAFFENLARNEVIIDEFKYVATDSQDGLSEATVSIKFVGRNDTPTAQHDLLELDENIVSAVDTVGGLIANDEDIDINGTPPDDDPWVIPQRAITTPLLNAAFYIETDGSYSYNANSVAIDRIPAGVTVTEDFPYILTDNSRLNSGADNFKLIVNSAEVILPVLANDDIAGVRSVSVTSYAAAVDPSIVVLESDNHELRDGQLIKIEDYTGVGEYNGVHAITVIDRDHFSVAVAFADDPAGARGTWRTWLNITAFSEPDNDGQVFISDDQQSLRYTPRVDFYGTDTFTYTIEDGVGGQDVAIVEMLIVESPLNSVVCANNDSFEVYKGQGAQVLDVLVNDNTLPELGSDLFVLETVIGSASGTLEVVNNGKSVLYTPASDTFIGTDTFTYTVSGGATSTAQAAVSINVIEVEHFVSNPGGVDDDFVVVADSTGNMFDVLANDRSLSNCPVTLELVDGQVSSPTLGGIATLDSGKIRYNAPASSVTGTDTFTYVVRDELGIDTTKTVSVEVVADVSNFYATVDRYTVWSGGPQISLSVLVNDAATGANSTNLEIVNLGLDTDAPPAPERVAFTSGSVNYTPADSATDIIEEFTYEISDGTTERREAQIYITVIGSDNYPELNPTNDVFCVAKNSTDVNLDVLVNDATLPVVGWEQTITAVGATSQGGVASVGDGSRVTYAPAAGFNGVETFTYTVTDAFGQTSLATVTVSVGSLITGADAYIVLENSSENLFQVLLNDDFLNRYAAEYKITAESDPANGVVTRVGTEANNHLIYTPDADFVGVDTFTYTVEDQTGGSAIGTVTVEVISEESDRAFATLTVAVAGVNDAPVLGGTADDSITDKQRTFPFDTVTLSDKDKNRPDPASSFDTDILSDDGPTTDQIQTVTIAFDSTLGTISTVGLTLQSAGLFQVIGTPTEVVAVLRAIEFTPFENIRPPVYYDAVFTLTVTDGDLVTPIVDLTTVTILAINDAPEPIDIAYTTPENQPIRLLADSTLLSVAFDFGDLAPDFVSVNGVGEEVELLPALQAVSVLSNDGDVDIDDDNTTIELINIHPTDTRLDLTSTASSLGASVVLDLRAARGETNILYDPRGSAILNALANGETIVDSFYYTVRDQHGAIGIAEISITVTGVNDVPTAQPDDGYEAEEDESLVISGSGVLSNDTDPDQDSSNPDDAPIISNVPATSDLGANLSFDGTDITYDPTGVDVFEALARNEFIEDSITYTISDENGGTSESTIALEIEGYNDAPIAANDLLETLENVTNVITAGPRAADGQYTAGLLSNDTEIDFDNSTPDDDHWVIPQREVTTDLGAALEIETDGSYSYDANSRLIDSLFEDELAVEVFPYIVTDNFRTSTAPDTFKVLTDSTNVTLPVLSNDDVAGSVRVAVLGYAEDAGDANRVIIESTNHELRDGLLIKIQSYAGSGAYNGVFPITVEGRNHFSIESSYADDPAGTRGTWRPWFNITALGETDQEGVVTIDPDAQAILYTPKAGFYGSESFQYTIEDGVGGQDVTIVEITVLKDPLNNVLSASDDHFQVGMGESDVEVDVLVNDNILPESGSAYTITDVSAGSASGVLSIISGGTALSYTPSSPSFSADETFTYTVSGGGSSSAQATVTFTVIDREDYLDGSNDDFVVVQDSSDNQLDVAANDASRPSFPVSFEVVSVSAPSAGGVASVVNGQVSYTPAASYTGVDSFTYTIRDASGANTTKGVDVQVVPTADDFYAADDHYIIVAGSGEHDLSVMFNDVSTGSVGPLSIINLGLDTQAPPAVERVSFTSGLVKYTVPATTGTEVFNYEIDDGTDQRREAVITVTIVDQLPTLPNALDDNYHVAKDSSGHSLDVMLNDSPLPSAGWTWTITGVTAANQGGSVAINGGTDLTYSPAVGFYGVESFDYTIEDVFGDTSTATVTVAVGMQLTEPDHYVVLQNSSANDFPVLLNDDILERFPADYTISAVSTPDQSGAVVIDGSGPNNQLLYTPDTDFVGLETFTYTVIDKTGATLVEIVTVEVFHEDDDRDDAELRVEITGVNDTPQLTGIADGATTDKQSVKPFPAVLITDLDEWAGDLAKWDGEQAQNITVEYDEAYGTLFTPGMTRTSTGVYQMTGTPADVTIALNAIVFTPYENFIDYINPGFYALDFDLSIDDTYLLGQVSDTATIVITPINDAPTLVSEYSDWELPVNSAPRARLLTPNFADVDDDIAAGELVWTASSNNPSLFDSITIDAAQQLLVVDFATDQFGVAEITVRATDRGGLFVETSFTVTIQGPHVTELDIPVQAIRLTKSFFDSRWRQSFRVTNEGPLPAEAFIVHLSDFNLDRLELIDAEYSSYENGSLNNFADDTRSSDAVTILQISQYVFSIKYDLTLEADESVVVHFQYKVPFESFATIRPTVEIEWARASGSGVAMMIDAQEDAETGEFELSFVTEAGHTYQLEYSSDLSTWFPWVESIPVSAFDTVVSVVDDGLNTETHPSLVPTRFYRLVDTTAP